MSEAPGKEGGLAPALGLQQRCRRAFFRSVHVVYYQIKRINKFTNWRRPKDRVESLSY